MGSQRMVDENCASADRSGVGILSEGEQETIQQIAEIYRRKIVVPCTACSYCMPCPSGVNIPENFAALNNKQMDMNAYYRWKMNRSYYRLARKPGRLNESKTNGSAALCTRCGKCAPKCPQHIDIPNELEKVTAAFGRR
jgi:predicted aldo/keto reductase-like oxidoreductase